MVFECISQCVYCPLIVEVQQIRRQFSGVVLDQLNLRRVRFGLQCRGWWFDAGQMDGHDCLGCSLPGSTCMNCYSSVVKYRERERERKNYILSGKT